MNDSLHQIRLELRGPIAGSPFAGRKKQPKLDYCRRQVNLYDRWAEKTGESVFQQQVELWQKRYVQVNLGKL